MTDTLDLADFPDPTLLLRVLLHDLAVTVGVEAPAAPWNGDPACLRIRVNGGTDDNVTDEIRFDVDALTDDDGTSSQLAGRARQRILAAAGRPIAGVISGVPVAGVIDTAATDQRPHPAPWGANSAVRNTTAAYRITQRRA